MTNTSEATPTATKPRDWIAVDQMVTRLMNNASDDFERDVIRLAAETSGGPDTDIPGGGDGWKAALTTAREHLQAALAEDLNDKGPAVIDDTHTVREALTEAAEHADLNEYDRERLIERLTDTVTTLTAQARENERLVISDWLLARAERLGQGGSVVVDGQARALGSAAARLRNTIEDAPPI